MIQWVIPDHASGRRECTRHQKAYSSTDQRLGGGRGGYHQNGWMDVRLPLVIVVTALGTP